jgi:TonB family protein
MNTFLNYLVEANIIVAFFLLAYLIFLSNETNFLLNRIILLVGLAAAIIFPLFQFQNANLQLPTLADAWSLKLLPVFTLQAEGNATEKNELFFLLQFILPAVYLAGALFTLGLFLVRIKRLITLIKSAKAKRWLGRFCIVETSQNNLSFSFFHFIFIGQTDFLSEKDKNQILQHEMVHARQYHSIDILLINILGILFWFNPLLRIYKNIFIQLHEFEADARAVRKHDMNDYCDLLARVALLSADIRIANNFSNSLTLKRIQMMRKIKLKIRMWKIAAMFTTLLLVFFMIACQDQVATNADLTYSSAIPPNAPPDVLKKYDEMKAAHPELTLLLLEIDDSESPKLEQIQKDVESRGKIISVNFIKPDEADSRNYLIIEYREQMTSSAKRSHDDNIYDVAEESAAPEGGITRLYEFLSTNMKYPEAARQKGLEGKVFVTFIVEPDGSISNVIVAKSVNTLLDAEAVRVIQSSPRWVPGKNNGIPIRQKMVLPVHFSLGNEKTTPK